MLYKVTVLLAGDIISCYPPVSRLGIIQDFLVQCSDASVDVREYIYGEDVLGILQVVPFDPGPVGQALGLPE